MEALVNGQIDAVTSDSLILAEYANQNPELAVVGGPLSEEPYGIGVPQGDSDFRELVDFTLQEMKKDGKLSIHQARSPRESVLLRPEHPESC